MKHIITVSVQLPLNSDSGANDYLNPSNWFWLTCLVIPRQTLCGLQLSYYPYKWIRYAVGSIVGAQGDLFFSADGALPADAVQYGERSLPEGSIDLYYHVYNEEKRRIFPLDPDINNSKMTSSAGSRRMSKFRDQVKSRERGRCALTNEVEPGAEAAHLIPYSQGNAYISNFIERRSRDDSDRVINSVDHVRNGLFLSSLAHKTMGVEFAFLPTPNFAMETEDVHPNSHYGAPICTTHIFTPAGLCSLHRDQHSTATRMSQSRNRLSITLLDAVYASAVLHHFGTPEYRDAFSSTWRSSYYPDSIMTSGQSSYKAMVKRRVLDKAKAEKQKRDREARRRNRQN